MKKIFGKFSKTNSCKQSQRGAMLVELLLSIALAAAMLPFVLKLQEQNKSRAENIVAAGEIKIVRNALEKYMSAHKNELLTPLDKTITRVKISDLSDFGLPEYLEKSNKFQLRILKTPDRGGRAALQGIVIMSGDYTALRTRKIAEIGGANTGFIDDKNVYGAFGTLHTGLNDIGGDLSNNSVTEATKGFLTSDEYIMRLPSDDKSDATFSGDLSLGGHDIINADLVNAKNLTLNETLASESVNTTKIIFNSRPTIENEFNVYNEATVNGNLSSDGRDFNISKKLTIGNKANFSLVTASELWVNKLSLSGLQISSSQSELKIGKMIDMSGGQITATTANIGFSGSITPRLYVASKIQDAANSDYFWDTTTNSAVFNDISIPVLNKMARKIIASNNTQGTESEKLMTAVSANANATATDFINAVENMKKIVTSKYQNLNLP